MLSDSSEWLTLPFINIEISMYVYWLIVITIRIDLHKNDKLTMSSLGPPQRNSTQMCKSATHTWNSNHRSHNGLISWLCLLPLCIACKQQEHAFYAVGLAFWMPLETTSCMSVSSATLSMVGSCYHVTCSVSPWTTPHTQPGTTKHFAR